MRLFAFVLCFGCQNIAPPTADDAVGTDNLCTTDADCASGTCVAGAGVCGVNQTELGALLVEITPPATETGFGGFRLLKTLAPAPRASEQTPVVVSEPPELRGDIRLSFAEVTCRPSPVEVTFTPIEAYLGIDTLRYSTLSEVGTEIVDQQHTDTHRYVLGGLPDGRYDVYVEDARQVDNSSQPGCAVAPQVFRDQNITSDQGLSRLRFDLVQPSVRTLRVLVPSPSDFDGWEVDVVHPTTGERLSSRATLSGQRVETRDNEQFAVAELRLSEVQGSDFVGPNQEQLRLRAPADSHRPTILMVLAGLEVFQRGEALVPRLRGFGNPVKYQAWIWRSPSGEAVQGKLSLSAIELDEVPDGVIGQFQAAPDIERNGLVEVELPPGRYRLRVNPTRGSGDSSFETVVTVWPPQDPRGDAVQGGQVIVVPKTATVRGRVGFLGRDPPLGTSVSLLGLIESVQNNSNERPFLPRSSNTLVEKRAFSVEEVDCRNCNGELGAPYSLVVAPPENSGLPWWVSDEVDITATDLDVGQLELGLPAVRAGVLEFKFRDGTLPFPRALLRAFALLDEQGQPVSDPTLPLCARRKRGSEPVACLARALEVAAARSEQDGAFRLLLPQRVERLIMPESADAGMESE